MNERATYIIGDPPSQSPWKKIELGLQVTEKRRVVPYEYIKRITEN